MSRLMALFCIFSVMSSAFANDVVKPTNTIDAAIGITTIDDMPVKYSVRDEGWRIQGKIYPLEEYHVAGLKPFFLQYEDADQLSMQLLEADAEDKCLKLGHLESIAQTSDLADPKVFWQAEISARNPYAQAFRCKFTIEVFRSVDRCLNRYIQALTAAQISLPAGIDSLEKLNQELAKLSGGGVQVREGSEICGLR